MSRPNRKYGIETLARTTKAIVNTLSVLSHQEYVKGQIKNKPNRTIVFVKIEFVKGS